MNEDKIFVDRKESLDELKYYMNEVKSQNSKFVLLKGEAGVGKTLLAEEFMDICREEGFTTFRGKCLYHESSDPFLPFYDLFEDHIDEESSDTGPANTRGAGRSLSLMGVEDNNQGKKNVSISDKREMFFNKITDLVHRLADENPLLLFLDDIHSIDESSSFLLHHLLRNTQNSKVLFIGAYRPEELKVNEEELPFEIVIRRMNEEKLVNTVEIDRLEFNHISRIIKQYLDENTVSASFIWTIYRESEGNPYFVFEIINSLIDEGIIDQDSFPEDIDDKLEDIKIPSTIKNITDRRLNSLNKKEKKVLMFASIIGNEFDFELLENVTKVDVIELLDIIDELIEKGIIKEKENTSKEIYKFNHVQERTAIYEDMGRSRKRIMHAKVADGIEQTYQDRLEEFYYDLSRHYYRGKDFEKSYKYSIKAGDQSINALAVATAIDYYERALKSLDRTNNIDNEEEKKLDLLRMIGKHSFDINKWDKSKDAWGKVLSLSKELDKKKIKIDSMIKLGTIHKEFNEYEKSKEILEESLSLSKKIDYNYGIAKSNLLLGYLHWRLGEFEKAKEHYDKGIKSAKEIEADRLLAEAYIDMGNIYTHKSDINKAIEYDKKSLEILKRYEASRNLGRVYNNIGDLYMKNKEWEESLEYFKKTIETGKQLENKKLIGWGHFNLAEALANLGNTDKALENAKKAKNTLRKINNHSGVAGSYRVLGTIYRLKGKLEKAEEYIKESQDMFKDPDIPFDRAQGKIELGKVYLEKNKDDKAINYLEDAKIILDELGAHQFVEDVEDMMKEIKE